MSRSIPILIIGALLNFTYAQNQVIKEEDAIINRRGSIIETSTILSYGGIWALIPKGSVIHTPQHYQKTIVTTPKGKLAGWKDFLMKNSGWIYTFEISREQASGKDEIDPKKLEAYKNAGKLVVATHNGNPIRVDKAAPVSDKK